jgi:hypothetical protein
MSSIKDNCGAPGCYQDCPAVCQRDEERKETEMQERIAGTLRRAAASEGYHLTDDECFTMSLALAKDLLK